MISVYSFTIQNGTCQRPRTLWNRSATKFVLPSEKSTRQMRLENGQSQLFDNIQNLFVKERFINQINSLIPIFDAVVGENRTEPMIRQVIARQSDLTAANSAVHPKLMRMAVSY